MNALVKDKLAVMGGKPVRTKPFPVKWPVTGKEERQNLLKVFDSGKWWYGEKVAEFEKKFASFQDAKYGVSCVNGTVGLEIALLACGIGAGNEVIVPPYTFMATASAVLKANAIPIFADIDLNTGNLNPKAAEKAITAKTRAIMPVHLAGLPVDMDIFKALAHKHKLWLIEDACHSWGSKWKGRGTGSIGDCGVFSFQMSKNITAGEGGIILTNNEEIADKARSFSNCGRSKGKAFYDHYLLGSNLRMTELQAAILLGQLTRLKEQTLKRQKNAALLDKGLKNIPGIAVVNKNDPRVTRRSYHLYIFRFVTGQWDGVSRDTFLKALNAEGISSHCGYPIPLYKNPLFQKSGKGPRYCPISCPYYGKKIDYTRVSCPNAEQICREACWIRQADLLAEPADMKDIITAVAKLWEYRKELRHG